MLGAARLARMKRELAQFEDRPPHGISCWARDEAVGHLEAQIVGGEGTPYDEGVFRLDVRLPDRYPFEPPKITFLTPIYHPNVDTGGRICLESLKLPPAGAWSPVLNVVGVLTTIQHLMAEPNPDDPLMADIAREFKYDRGRYEATARAWTLRHARGDRRGQGTGEGKGVEVQGQEDEKKLVAVDGEGGMVGSKEVSVLPTGSGESRAFLATAELVASSAASKDAKRDSAKIGAALGVETGAAGQKKLPETSLLATPENPTVGIANGAKSGAVVKRKPEAVKAAVAGAPLLEKNRQGGAEGSNKREGEKVALVNAKHLRA